MPSLLTLIFQRASRPVATASELVLCFGGVAVEEGQDSLRLFTLKLQFRAEEQLSVWGVSVCVALRHSAAPKVLTLHDVQYRSLTECV